MKGDPEDIRAILENVIVWLDYATFFTFRFNINGVRFIGGLGGNYYFFIYLIQNLPDE
jgi:hypothetical protein